MTEFCKKCYRPTSVITDADGPITSLQPCKCNTFKMGEAINVIPPNEVHTAFLSKFDDPTEHNHVVGMMYNLIALGLQSSVTYSSATLLYINHLIEGLRK